MAGVMPGQNTEDSAWEVMEVMPLCAEWRKSKTSFLREGGGEYPILEGDDAINGK